jgi:NAD+-dependent farnesol dehydrogenase
MALGPSDGRPLTEEDPRRTDHFHNDYERTKYLGDQVARKLQSEGHPVKIIYPGVIYGPGNLTDGNIIAKNIIPLLNGKMPFGLGILTWSYSYVADVIEAFLKVVESETPSGRYILGGDNRSGEEFYRDLSEVSGKKPPAMNIPMGMAKMAGFSEYLLAQLFGREPKMLTHEVVEIYKHSWAYDSNRAQKELGYRITPLKSGLAAMIEWLRASGYVK